jgi:hypothetical protein
MLKGSALHRAHHLLDRAGEGGRMAVGSSDARLISR